MKKIIWAIASCILLVGCGQQKVTLNLEEISNKVSTLTYQNKEMFNQNEILTESKLKSKYNLDTSNIESFKISMPTLMESSNMYMIVLPKEGKTQEVKTAMNQLLEKVEASWTVGNYAPKEADKVKNRLETSYGNYLIYIISDDNDLVLKTIKE